MATRLLPASTLTANSSIHAVIYGLAALCGVVVGPIECAKTPFLRAETARARCFVTFYFDCRLLFVRFVRL
jgi:hypothetical protein